jgi:hypothetical protein
MMMMNQKMLLLNVKCKHKRKKKSFLIVEKYVQQINEATAAAENVTLGGGAFYCLSVYYTCFGVVKRLMKRAARLLLCAAVG